MIFSLRSSKFLERSYQTYASEHAGVNGKQSDQFYVDAGQYNNMEEYNRAKRQQRNYDLQYRDESLYWSWDSSANREFFKDMRIRSDKQMSHVYYYIGGMLLNRLISGVDAAHSLTSRQQQGKKSHQLGIGIDPGSSRVSLVWQGTLFR